MTTGKPRRPPAGRGELDKVLSAHQRLVDHDATRPSLVDQRAHAINNARNAGVTLREIAEALGVTGERARQMGQGR